MKVLIVGLKHRLQLSAIVMENVDSRPAGIERQQKEQFKQRLRELVEQQGVHFIGEEMEAATSIPNAERDRQFAYKFLRAKGSNPVAPSTPIEV
ncbi:MAG: hypothetical protein O7A06_14405, partial [Acidobacteria bacterium]|nr:hypothetical protein [Acidobacteriota bacterium]